MRIRRARPEEYAEIGEVTIAAYEPFLVGAEDGYRDRLLDVAGRDREAEVWVATPDDSDEILGNVTVCPVGSPWRELAKDGEGEFRMLAVSPTAQGRGVGGADGVRGRPLPIGGGDGDGAVQPAGDGRRPRDLRTARLPPRPRRSTGTPCPTST